MTDPIGIDGSLLEGGGQILRIALTLSCIKKIPIRIYNIRAGRGKPGLMEQHLKGVELLRDICDAQVKGATIGSTEITFCPAEIRGGTYNAFIKTAGSISLLLQVALPCCIFAKSDVILKLRGGTNAEMAPQVDYMTEVFRPVLEKFGATFDFDLVRRGYFPKGGGEVIVTIQPVKELHGIKLLNQGKVMSIQGWSFVAGVIPAFIADKIAAGAKKTLSQVCRNVHIESYKEDKDIAPDNASGIILQATTDTGCILGASALGKRTENAEVTGERAGEILLKSVYEGACVDEHCQDQIIVFMALAVGPSSVRVGEITLHTKTAIFVVELLCKVEFNIEALEEGGNIIHCTGQ
ncbi:RNA 3'-terminal phosphate cyclase [Anthonomus grandis grandis]|uniref:RNA 3'-terminal phosphate cyclase n=1 Tax=Anthonomus grandis grandis TaxID=2921223 RepID=UPI002165B0CC|nr:RNA 3'-terminal phosphate cyclase [Anthonomus grandis grandis]